MRSFQPSPGACRCEGFFICSGLVAWASRLLVFGPQLNPQHNRQDRSPKRKQGTVEVQRATPLLALRAPIQFSYDLSCCNYKHGRSPRQTNRSASAAAAEAAAGRTAARSRLAARNGRPGPIIRVAISLLIVWHFAGVFLAALSIGGHLAAGHENCPAASDAVVSRRPVPESRAFVLRARCRPGHVIRYELFDQSNQVLEQGELPSRKDQWPRLFYHRHMMLADQSEMPSDDKQFRDFWQRKYLEAYGDHLLRVNEKAQSVRLQRIAHWPLPRDLAVQGRQMTDPESYELMLEVTQRRSDLPPEPTSQSQSPNLNWQYNRANVANRGMGGLR